MRSQSVDKVVSEKYDISANKASRIRAEIFTFIANELLAGRPVSQRSFGTFKLASRKGSTVNVFKTGDVAVIPDRALPLIIFSGKLKRRIKAAIDPVSLKPREGMSDEETDVDSADSASSTNM